MRAFLSALLCASLAGCSLLGGGEVLDIYELRAPADLPRVERPIARIITVELPEATGTLDTDRILIRPDNLQAQYLPGVRWGEEVPIMVQTLMLRSLQSTGGLTYVGRRPLGSGGDFAIVSDIIDFQAETLADAARVRVTLEVRIVRERDAAITAGRTFEAEVMAESTATADLIAAFDVASSELFNEFTLWTMARLGRPL